MRLSIFLLSNHKSFRCSSSVLIQINKAHLINHIKNSSPCLVSSGAAPCSWWTVWRWSAASSWASPPSAPPTRWWSPVAWSSACSAASSPAWLPCTSARCRPLPSEEPSARCTSSVWWWASWSLRSAGGYLTNYWFKVPCISQKKKNFRLSCGLWCLDLRSGGSAGLSQAVAPAAGPHRGSRHPAVHPAALLSWEPSLPSY